MQGELMIKLLLKLNETSSRLTSRHSLNLLLALWKENPFLEFKYQSQLQLSKALKVSARAARQGLNELVNAELLLICEDLDGKVLKPSLELKNLVLDHAPLTEKELFSESLLRSGYPNELIDAERQKLVPMTLVAFFLIHSDSRGILQGFGRAEIARRTFMSKRMLSLNINRLLELGFLTGVVPGGVSKAFGKRYDSVYCLNTSFTFNGVQISSFFEYFQFQWDYKSQLANPNWVASIKTNPYRPNILYRPADLPHLANIYAYNLETVLVEQVNFFVRSELGEEHLSFLNFDADSVDLGNDVHLQLGGTDFMIKLRRIASLLYTRACNVVFDDEDNLRLHNNNVKPLFTTSELDGTRLVQGPHAAGLINLAIISLLLIHSFWRMRGSRVAVSVCLLPAQTEIPNIWRKLVLTSEG